MQFEEMDDSSTLKKGLIAKCDLIYKKNGDIGPSAKDLKLGLESPLYGIDEKIWGDAMSAVKSGEKKELAITFHEGFSENKVASHLKNTLV